ncbi:restriction endonuclease subunit S [Pseudonocardia sp. GCM10023141]|uniref:restriction endonuclease subunit S n=1 Tax=Pseudonocardia sp. GCM10023141 TaxID=3252653 RepID=UPI00361AE97D
MGDQAEWEHKPLSDVGELARGRRFTKNDYVETGLGCIHYSQVFTHFEAVARHPLTFLPESSRPRMRLAHPGDLVIAATSENVAEVGKAVAWLGGDDVAVHDDCYIFRHGLNPAYVSYFFASSLFHEQKIKYVSETKVVRISGANLNLIEIPIPPAPVQDRIVEIIGAVDDQVAALDAEADALDALFRGRKEELFAYYAATGTPLRIGQVLEEVKRPIAVDPEAEYWQIGIRSHGRGLFTKEAVTGESLGSKKVFGVEPGDLVINIVFAWEGAVAIVPPEIEGYCGSHRFPAYRRPGDGDVEFFRLFFSTKTGTQLLASCSPGGAGRNRTLSRKRLMQSIVGMPSTQEQKRAICELQALEACVEAVHTEADRLRAVRAALLSGLLDRSVELTDAEREV